MSLWHKSTVNKRRWKPVRLDILDLANWRCRSCGGYANEVDHRIPVHLGGEPYQRDNLQAHAHYRSGETKDAITDANNAFESTLKAICDQRRWPYDRGCPGVRPSQGGARARPSPRLSRRFVRPTGRDPKGPDSRR